MQINSDALGPIGFVQKKKRPATPTWGPVAENYQTLKDMKR